MRAIIFAITVTTAVVLLATTPVLAQDEDFVLGFSEEEGEVGGTATVAITLENEDDIRGFHWGVCHDDLVSIEEDDIEDGDGFDSASVDFQSIEVFDDGWTVDSLWCVACDDIELPSGEHEMFLATYSLLEAGTAELEYCETLGDPEVTVRIVDSGGEDDIEPTLEDGSITILGESFLRGDADSSGDVSGIPDGLFLLRWQFDGGADPTCADAADADDSGTVSGLPDGLYVLRWYFEGGAEPPAPGIDACGPDPEGDEPDELDCEVTSKTCQ